MIVTMVLVAWAYLPVPAALGAVLGLTRVESYRLAYPLAVASAIGAGLWVHRCRTDPRFRPSRRRIGLATAGFAFGAGWSAYQYKIDNIAPSRASMLLLVLAFTAAVAFVLRGRIILGLGGACALLLFGAVRVNPIQIGLGPVTANALTHQIEAVRAGDATSRWAYIGPDFGPNALLMASGAPLATGVSWYADPAFWHRLDPASTVRSTWDRYAIVTMQIDESISGEQLELASAVSIVIHTSTCSGALQDLEVRYVVADASTSSPCLKAIDTPQNPGQRFIYEVVVPK